MNFKLAGMDKLLYKVIKSDKQYFEYCNKLQNLVVLKKRTRDLQNEIELLTLLIEKWDEEHSPAKDADPIELLRFLMSENKLKSVDLAILFGVSVSLVSDILNYRRGLSKDIIRKLSERFKVKQDLLNKPYKLISEMNSKGKDSGMVSARKRLQKAS